MKMMRDQAFLVLTLEGPAESDSRQTKQQNSRFVAPPPDPPVYTYPYIEVYEQYHDDPSAKVSRARLDGMRGVHDKSAPPRADADADADAG